MYTPNRSEIVAAAVAFGAMVATPQPADAKTYILDARRDTANIVAQTLTPLPAGSFAFEKVTRINIAPGQPSYVRLEHDETISFTIVGPIKTLPIKLRPIKGTDYDAKETSGYRLEITIDGVHYIKDNTVENNFKDDVLVLKNLGPGAHVITIKLATSNCEKLAIGFPLDSGLTEHDASIQDDIVFNVNPDTMPLTEKYPPGSDVFQCHAEPKVDNKGTPTDSSDDITYAKLVATLPARFKDLLGDSLGSQPIDHDPYRANVYQFPNDHDRSPDGLFVFYTVVSTVPNVSGIPYGDRAADEHCRLQRFNPPTEAPAKTGVAHFKADLAVAPNGTMTPIFPDSPVSDDGGPQEPLSCVFHAVTAPAGATIAPQGTVYCRGVNTGVTYVTPVRPNTPFSDSNCVNQLTRKITAGQSTKDVCSAGELSRLRFTFEKVGQPGR